MGIRPYQLYIILIVVCFLFFSNSCFIAEFLLTPIIGTCGPNDEFPFEPREFKILNIFDNENILIKYSDKEFYKFYKLNIREKKLYTIPEFSNIQKQYIDNAQHYRVYLLNKAFYFTNGILIDTFYLDLDRLKKYNFPLLNFPYSANLISPDKKKIIYLENRTNWDITGDPMIIDNNKLYLSHLNENYEIIDKILIKEFLRTTEYNNYYNYYIKYINWSSDSNKIGGIIDAEVIHNIRRFIFVFDISTQQIKEYKVNELSSHIKYLSFLDDNHIGFIPDYIKKYYPLLLDGYILNCDTKEIVNNTLSIDNEEQGQNELFIFTKDSSFFIIIFEGDLNWDYYQYSIFKWDIKNNTVNKENTIKIYGKKPQVSISKDNKNIWITTWIGIMHEGRCPKDSWEETIKWNIYKYNIDEKINELVEITPNIFNNINDEIKL